MEDKKISLAEFRFNFRLLLDIRFKMGLPLGNIEQEYLAWFGEAITLRSLDPHQKTWKGLFVSKDILTCTFTVFSKNRVEKVRSNEEMGTTETKDFIKFANYRAIQKAKLESQKRRTSDYTQTDEIYPQYNSNFDLNKTKIESREIGKGQEQTAAVSKYLTANYTNQKLHKSTVNTGLTVTEMAKQNDKNGESNCQSNEDIMDTIGMKLTKENNKTESGPGEVFDNFEVNRKRKSRQRGEDKRKREKLFKRDDLRQPQVDGHGRAISNSGISKFLPEIQKDGTVKNKCQVTSEKSENHANTVTSTSSDIHVVESNQFYRNNMDTEYPKTSCQFEDQTEQGTIASQNSLDKASEKDRVDLCTLDLENPKSSHEHLPEVSCVEKSVAPCSELKVNEAEICSSNSLSEFSDSGCDGFMEIPDDPKNRKNFPNAEIVSSFLKSCEELARGTICNTNENLPHTKEPEKKEKSMGWMAYILQNDSLETYCCDELGQLFSWNRAHWLKQPTVYNFSTAFMLPPCTVVVGEFVKFEDKWGRTHVEFQVVDFWGPQCEKFNLKTFKSWVEKFQANSIGSRFINMTIKHCTDLEHISDWRIWKDFITSKVVNGKRNVLLERKNTTVKINGICIIRMLSNDVQTSNRNGFRFRMGHRYTYDTSSVAHLDSDWSLRKLVIKWLETYFRPFERRRKMTKEDRRVPRNPCP